MMGVGNRELLEILINFIQENGLENDFTEWAENYDHDKDELLKSIENSYKNN